MTRKLNSNLYKVVVVVALVALVAQTFARSGVAHATGPIALTATTWPQFHGSNAVTGYNPSAVGINRAGAGTLSGTAAAHALNATDGSYGVFPSAPVVNPGGTNALVYVSSSICSDNNPGGRSQNCNDGDGGAADGYADGTIASYHASNLGTGTDTWSYDMTQWTDSSPLVYQLSGGGYRIYQGTLKTANVNGTVYYNDSDGHMYSMDAASGAVQWDYAAVGNIESSPVAANVTISGNAKDVLYFAYGLSDVANNVNKVVAVDASTGSVYWSYTMPKNAYNNDSSTVWGPLAFANLKDGGGTLTPYLFFGSSDNNDSRVACGGGAGTCPIFNDNSVYCLNASTGSVVWTYQAGNSDTGDIGAGPTIFMPSSQNASDAHIYVGTKNVAPNASATVSKLIDLSGTGSVNWAATIPNPDRIVSSTPALVQFQTGTAASNYYVFVGDDHGVLYRYRASDGHHTAATEEVALDPIYAAITAGNDFNHSVLYVPSGNEVFMFNPNAADLTLPASELGELGPWSYPTSSVTVVDDGGGTGHLYFGVGYYTDQAQEGSSSQYFVMY